MMSRMISILDTKAPDDMKENFYHGLLLGLLRGSNPDWLIKSNRELGDGFSDILAYGIAFCRKRCRVVGEKL